MQISAKEIENLQLYQFLYQLCMVWGGLCRVTLGNKKPQSLTAVGVSGLCWVALCINVVPRAGLEPAHPKARDFKSLVSTDFTIWAEVRVAG